MTEQDWIDAARLFREVAEAISANGDAERDAFLFAPANRLLHEEDYPFGMAIPLNGETLRGVSEAIDGAIEEYKWAPECDEATGMWSTLVLVLAHPAQVRQGAHPLSDLDRTLRDCHGEAVVVSGEVLQNVEAFGGDDLETSVFVTLTPELDLLSIDLYAVSPEYHLGLFSQPLELGDWLYGAWVIGGNDCREVLLNALKSPGVKPLYAVELLSRFGGEPVGIDGPRPIQIDLPVEVKTAMLESEYAEERITALTLLSPGNEPQTPKKDPRRSL